MCVCVCVCVCVYSCEFAQSERPLRAAALVFTSNAGPVQLRFAARRAAHLLRPLLLGGRLGRRQRHRHSHAVSNNNDNNKYSSLIIITKYSFLPPVFIFQPVEIETLGPSTHLL